MKTKLLWAELERAADRTRELEAALREARTTLNKVIDMILTNAELDVKGELIDRLHALAAWPEVAGRPQDRLPGAVLQANSDGTISKVEAP